MVSYPYYSSIVLLYVYNKYGMIDGIGCPPQVTEFKQSLCIKHIHRHGSSEAGFVFI